MITSVRNTHAAQARRLHRASARRRSGLALYEGPRLVAEAARAGVLDTVLVVHDAESAVRGAAEAAAQAGAEVLACAPHVVASAADSASQPGVVAIGRRPCGGQIQGRTLVLIVDGVQDPGNLGALVRTGAAAGATLIARTPGSADPFGPKALRAGAGGHFRVPVLAVTAPDDLPPPAAGAALYTASADADLVYHDVDWTAPCGLIVGAETAGVSQVWRQASRAGVRVPMRRGVESLNTAAAAAVILFEAARQRAGRSTTTTPR